VARLETAIASRLQSEAAARRLDPGADAARLAGVTAFAVTHLAIARMSTGAHSDHDPLTDLQRQIGQVVTGFLGTGEAAA
jgi:hypothetical protein